jgi:hypothetical protein
MTHAGTLLFIIDPLSSLNPKKDSTIAMMEAAQKRGIKVGVIEDGGLAWSQAGGVTGEVKWVHVDMLGHPLALRSVPGRGSCFSLDLPACLSVPPLAPLPLGAGGAVPLAGRHLWLLDDDPVLRGALAARLAAWGATVLALGSLAALQQALKEVRFAAPVLLRA